MDEHVLVLGLHQEVPLRPDVLQEAEHVGGAALLQHVHHRVQHDVGAGPPDARAAGERGGGRSHGGEGGGSATLSTGCVLWNRVYGMCETVW